MLDLMKAALIVVVLIGEVVFIAGNVTAAPGADGTSTRTTGDIGFWVVIAAGLPLILLLVAAR